MTATKHFDRRIIQFLKQQPQSDAALTIKEVEKQSRNFTNYFGLLDDFSFKLGIGVIAQEIVDKNDNTIGYIPCIKYYPDNFLKEEPRTDRLISNSSPMKLNLCYEFLAKELVYRIMKIDNLKVIISKIYNS